MCGIAGFTVREPGRVAKLGTLADNLLRNIEPRGRDATGLLALGSHGVHLEKNTRNASRFIYNRKSFPDTSRTVLLHTRYATVGSARDPKNAHPVASGKVAVTHNGTIWNDMDIFAEIGRSRFADVDSEAIAALLDWAGWDLPQDALGLLVGGAAIAAIHTDHTDEVLLARLNGFPLHYMVTDDLIVWASTRHAIEGAWKTTYKRVKMGAFVDMPEWTVHRIAKGAVASRHEIQIEAKPPGHDRVYTRPTRTYTTVAPKHSTTVPNRKRSRRTTPTTTRALDLTQDERAWARDVSEAEFEQMAIADSGRWSADGAWELDDASDCYYPPAASGRSIFDMTDEEFAKWCESQGFTEEDDDA